MERGDVMKIQKIYAFVVVAFAFTHAHAQVYQSCDQWATYTQLPFRVYNNIWGGGAGSQCLSVNSYQSWSVTANHPNTSGVKSYPNVSYEMNTNVDQLGTCASSFNVTAPNSGSYA